jgi:hypothetical protein
VELEQRIARLEAIEAIKQLKAKYFAACDNKQPEFARECFVDGPVDIQYGRIGNFDRADDVIEVFRELACHEHIVEIHHGQNPQICVQSDTHACATWGLYYYMIDTRQQTATQLGGYYEDEYRCVDGEWKISKTAYQLVSTQVMDVAEGLARVLFAGRTAPADIDDPSRQAAD